MCLAIHILSLKSISIFKNFGAFAIPIAIYIHALESITILEFLGAVAMRFPILILTFFNVSTFEVLNPLNSLAINVLSFKDVSIVMENFSFPIPVPFFILSLKAIPIFEDLDPKAMS